MIELQLLAHFRQAFFHIALVRERIGIFFIIQKTLFSPDFILHSPIK